MAAIRDFAYGGIAVDSIVLSPECRHSTGHYLIVFCIFNTSTSTVKTNKLPSHIPFFTGNSSLEGFPKPPKNPCAEPDKMCDFHSDCAKAEDEAKCGASICSVYSASL